MGDLEPTLVAPSKSCPRGRFRDVSDLDYDDIGLWNKRIMDARTVADDGKPHAYLGGGHVDGVKCSW